MGIDFERTRHELSGHLITVTSWFDNRTNLWSAAAPAYSHVLIRGGDQMSGSSTRKEAITEVLQQLAQYFDGRK
jgi:hypothetical protein